MGEVGKRSGDDLGAATRVDMTVWVDSLDGAVGIWRGRLIIEEVIHQEITILLADEAIRSALDVLVVITRGKGILILAAQTLHRVLLAIFQGIYLPTGVGVEDIGYQDMLALLQLPILRITLTIVVLLRSAMESKENAYQIIVDNHASRENTTRYAQHQGYQVAVDEKDGEWTLTFTK